MAPDRSRRDPGSPRITDPKQIDNPELRAFALTAVKVAKLEDALDLLTDLTNDLYEERFGNEETPDPQAEQAFYEDEPFAIAASVMQVAFEDADRALEADVQTWLAHDPEHWHIFRLVILNPWMDAPGRWRSDAPRWVLALGTNVVYAHIHPAEYDVQEE
jgi:hypothetical protein